MLSHRNKYLIYLVLLNGLLITLLFCFWRYIFEDSRSLSGLTFSMMLFFFYELFIIFFTESRGETISTRQSINLFLGFKVGKILLSLLFIGIYISVINAELKKFLGVFILMYLIFLLFDTFYLATREKAIKKKNQQYKLKEIEKLSNYFKK